MTSLLEEIGAGRSKGKKFVPKAAKEPKPLKVKRNKGGRPKKKPLLVSMPDTNDPIEFLTQVMNNDQIDVKQRMIAAKTAARHVKKAREIGGKKGQKLEAAAIAATGIYAPLPPPTGAPVKKRTWTTACPDWEKRIVAERSLIPFKPLFPNQAESALTVFKSLKIVDMPNSPTFGEVSRQWLFDLTSAIFGSYDADSGRQLINEFFVCVSKKNTKSTAAAAIMLTALIRNWREVGEFTILAPTIEVANNSFNPARDMVRRSEELSDLFHVQEHYRTITHRNNGCNLKVVAADSESVGGKKGIGTLVEELWLFGRRPQSENMLREATGGLASRPEGFTIYLTTQSDDPPAGVFRQKLMYARGVRDGRIVDPKFLPVLYEFPEAMIKKEQYKDKKKFYITNPNLGASVDVEFIERLYAQAQEGGPESLSGFFAKHLNVEIGLRLLSNRWPGADHWEACAIPVFTLAELLERCEVVCLGIDGGGLNDLLGFAAVGRDAKTKDWIVWTRAWAHPSVLELHKAEADRLKDFAADGDLVLVEVIGEDVDEVVDLVEQVVASGKLDKTGVDPSGIGAILDAIVAAGVPQENVVGIAQGWKLNGAIKTTERKLAEGSMKHGGQRAMNWVVGNAKVEARGNAVIVTKQVSGSAKIDPLMAVFNAVSLMSLNPDSKGRLDDFLRNPVII